MAGGRDERLGVVGRSGAYSRQGWIASSFTSTSCRASMTARPISGSRSRWPARPCATGRAWSPARRTRRSWTSPRSPSGCASCERRCRRRASTSRSAPAPSSAWYDVADARRRRARDGRPGPARTGAGCCSRRRCRAPARPRACADSAAELRERGFGVLIGHPERSPALAARRRAPSRTCWPPATGCRSTRSSLTGYHGAGARAAALELVERRAARRSSPPTPISPALAPRA